MIIHLFAKWFCYLIEFNDQSIKNDLSYFDNFLNYAKKGKK